MYKAVAIWGTREDSDIEAFEKDYREVHVPLARKVPGLKKLILTRIDSGLEGAKPPFYRVAELYFDSKEALEKAQQTPEWIAMRENGARMVERFGVTLAAAFGTPQE